MTKSTIRIIAPVCAFGFALTLAAFGEKPSQTEQATSKSGQAALIKVKVVALGISQKQIDAVESALPQNRSLAPLLQGANYRLLYTEPLESAGTAPDSFRTVFYDYTRQRTIVVEGSLGRPAAAVAQVVRNWQPYVNDDEFQDAVAVLAADPVFGPALNSRAATTYRPMPPVQGWADDGPVTARIVNVGLLPQPAAADFQHEIVGVNLAQRTIVRYPGTHRAGQKRIPAPSAARPRRVRRRRGAGRPVNIS